MTGEHGKAIDPALLNPGLRLQKVVGSAEQMKCSSQVPLKRYYRSLLEIEKMAKSYIDDKNLERAFVLLYRFCWFAVSELKKHPNYSEHQSEEKEQVNNLLSPALALADEVKSELMKVYNAQAAYYQLVEQRRELRIEDQASWLKTNAEAQQQITELLRVAEETTNRAGMAMGVVAPIQPNPDDSTSSNSSPPAKRVLLNPHQHVVIQQAPAVVDPKITTANIEYGNVLPPQSAADRSFSPIVPPGSSGSAFKPIPHSTPAPSSPTENVKFAAEYPSLASGQKPTFTRENKPELTEGDGFGKRMAVASDLVEKFLDQVSDNTKNNIETCGILGGTSVRDRFVVTHIVIPKQTGTANGCIAEGDEEVSQALDGGNLLSLGWIHTHPTQTAFLSSVDLHTHHSYQRMMSESVAIVCAPAHNEVGTFVLTPEGMEVIGSCNLRGFHPHPESVGTLFTSASHVHYTSSVSTTIIDVRNK